MADDRLIVALDVATMEQLKNLVTTLGDSVSYYKVGMELFYAAGAETVTYLQEQGKWRQPPKQLPKQLRNYR